MARAARGSPLPEKSARAELVALKRAHNELKHEIELRKQRVELMRIQVSRIEQQRQIAQLGAPHAGSTEQLEEAIAEMERNLEQAEAAQLMYLQMVERVKGESTHFNRDLNRIRAAAGAKEQDEVELGLIVKDALHLRNLAKLRCAEEKQSALVEQRSRASELAKRKEHIERRRDAAEEEEAACAARREELARVQEQARIEIARALERVNPSTAEQELERIRRVKDEFRRIQTVLGSSEPDEIVATFARQQAQCADLKGRIDEHRERIADHEGARAEAQAAVMRLRFEGVGEPAEPRPARRAGALKAIASLADGGGAEAAAPLWGSQHDVRLSRAVRTLAEVHAGVQHLTELLAGSSALCQLEPFAGPLETDDQLVQVGAGGRARAGRDARTPHALTRLPALRPPPAPAQALQHLLRTVPQLAAQPAPAELELREGGSPEGPRGEESVSPARSPEVDGVFPFTSAADNFRLAELDEPLGGEDDEDDEEGELLKGSLLSSADIKDQGRKLISRHARARRRKGNKAAAAGPADDGAGGRRSLQSAGGQSGPVS